MSEFKMGELIEVSDDNDEAYKERIFIKKGYEFGVICVARHYEDNFKKDKEFDTWWWRYARKIKQPEYVPFTFDDYEQLIGKAVRQLILNYVNLIVKIREGAILIGDTYYNYEELLNKFEFLDGSPCGKLK
jgi:hypothetical protein